MEAALECMGGQAECQQLGQAKGVVQPPIPEAATGKLDDQLGCSFESAVRLLQHAWRRRLAKLHAASTILQAHARGRLARRKLREAVSATVHIQACWRGFVTRTTSSPAAKRHCHRLTVLAAHSISQAQLWLTTRALQALRTLSEAKQVPQVSGACRTLHSLVQVSIPCRRLVIERGGLKPLVAFAATCNRSKPHVAVLLDSLGVLGLLGRDRRVRGSVWGCEGLLDMLAGQLQVFREHEAVFMACVHVLSALASHPQGAAAVAAQQGPLRQMLAVCQLLARKIDTEQMHLGRLEGEKGSDASARENTRRLLSSHRQHHALSTLLSTCTGNLPSAATVSVRMLRDSWEGPAPASESSCGSQPEAAWRYRNSLVRDALHQLGGGQGRRASIMPKPQG